MVANYGMNPYGINPYASTSMNEDFMYNAASLPQQASIQQAMAYQQPQADTFQQQNGTGLNTGLKLAAVGGAAGAAGSYFFSDKLDTNFVKDGKFSDDLLKAVDTNVEEVALKNCEKSLLKQKNAIAKKYGFANVKELEAVNEYLTVADKTKLPKSVTDLVPDAVKKSPDTYEAKMFKVNSDISKIDLEKLADKALEKAKAGNFAYQLEELTNFTKQKTLLDGLAKDANLTQIEELIKNNAKTFGITATEETEIANQAKALAKKYGTKTNALTQVTNSIKSQQTLVNNTRTTLNGKVANYWDDAAKAFKADTPEALTKASKNFKIAKAGKVGAIAAGAGLVLGWMFGK